MKRGTLILFFTFSLAVFIAIASYAGMFIPGTYARETLSYATQGIGQDAVNLFFIVPVLLISGWMTYSGNKMARYIYGGTIIYIAYTYIIYAVGVHFNSLFLAYCAILGLSVYAIIVLFATTDANPIKDMYDEKAPVRTVGIFFLFMAALFSSLWLREIIPALMAGGVPKSIEGTGLLVNPVHVLDLSIFLPGLVATAILLFKKHALGFLLAPMLLVFCVLMGVALWGMVVALVMNGVSEDITVAWVFAGIAAISTTFLVMFLTHMHVGKEPGKVLHASLNVTLNLR
jgi:hypothetical protein